MPAGLPTRVTLLTWEEVRAAKELCVAGKPHRDIYARLVAAEALAKRADNGVASGFLDIRAGVTDEEHAERQMAREARQVKRRRLAAMARQRGEEREAA